MPAHHSFTPGPARLEGPVQTLSPGLLALLAFLAEPFGAGTAPPRTLASRGWAAPVRHAKDGDGRWWPRATSLAPCSGRAPTGAEAGLRGGQCAGAAVAALPPLAQQRLGRVSVLAAAPAIVTVSHDDALAPCMPAAPLGGPAVTDLVEGAQGQHRTGPAPLGRPCLLLSPLPIFPHARFAPRAPGADDALVPKAVCDALHPPGLGERLVPPRLAASRPQGRLRVARPTVPASNAGGGVRPGRAPDETPTRASASMALRPAPVARWTLWSSSVGWPRGRGRPAAWGRDTRSTGAAGDAPRLSRSASARRVVARGAPAVAHVGPSTPGAAACLRLS